MPSRPSSVTDKTTEQGADTRYIFSVSEMQGWRACKSGFQVVWNSVIAVLQA